MILLKGKKCDQERGFDSRFVSLCAELPDWLAFLLLCSPSGHTPFCSKQHPRRTRRWSVRPYRLSCASTAVSMEGVHALHWFSLLKSCARWRSSRKPLRTNSTHKTRTSNQDLIGCAGRCWRRTAISRVERFPS